jgi:proteasome lid subunit RPN8/RPN11
MDTEVSRSIRQHARAHMKTEVCGVLIGEVRDRDIHVQASIEGLNASQAGTHVTFTQDTWEHVYKIKDKDYPEDRIVGWYHSHPGFGVFLSDHDTFIHKNFFSSENQIAWVYDPHSDEEGCFGWNEGQIERMKAIRLSDRRGGETPAGEPRPEPAIVVAGDDEDPFVYPEPRPEKTIDQTPPWMRWSVWVLSHAIALCLGLIIAWYVVPRLVFIAVPVDPMTGHPLENFAPMRIDPDSRFKMPATDKLPSADQSNAATPSKADDAKGNDAQRKR